MAKDMGVERALHPVDWLSGSELHAAYHASDIVLQPSVYFEPFGLIALEAMACKKPVIASLFGGLPEIVENGITGYTVDARNTEHFADAVVSLLQNTQKAREMGIEGYDRAAREFSPDMQISALLSYYEAKS